MKTKLGITAGALAAIAYLAGYFSGYIVLFLIVGYVFIIEENDWLKMSTLKALCITLCFDLVIAVLGFIPDILNTINSMFNIWKSSITGNDVVPAIQQIISFLNRVLSLAEKVLMLLLAYYATKLKTINIGFIDKIVDKITAKL
ncbi:MAG: hypothetical protein K6E62_04260 [Lachnospiraceae bacterium]|nr:hypothetical protein [Lachnospiraceae bacterium]